MNPLITPAEAEILILRHLAPLPTEFIALERADRRILAAPLHADRPLPPYDRVMMDGICFHASAPPPAGTRLRIAGLHAAGDPAPPPLAPGSCREVMTGARLPADCNTVVPYEQMTRDGDHAVLTASAPVPGTHVHLLGSDFPEGAELVPAGTPVTSRVAAVAATVGATALNAIRKPRLTILTTGDELVPPEQVPAPHQVRRSNDVALRAALAQWGPCELTLLHLPDSSALLESALRTALATSDLILTCGAISLGRRDHVRPVLEKLLGPPVFHGVAQRPGKPLAFWAGPPPVIALPGNPMSVLVCFHRYVLPALHRLTKHPFTRPLIPLAEDFQFPPSLTCFLPVLLTPRHHALPRPLQNSGDFASAIDSTGFLELAPDPSSFPRDFCAPYIPWL